MTEKPIHEVINAMLPKFGVMICVLSGVEECSQRTAGAGPCNRSGMSNRADISPSMPLSIAIFSKCIRDKEGRYCPRVIGDHCGEQIDDAGEANACFAMNINNDLYFVHKKCQPQWDRERREDIPGAEELQVWLVFLLNNLKFTGKVEKRAGG
jgi:hypothetical protein